MIEIFIASIANFTTRVFPFIVFKKIPKRLKIFELYFPATILIILILYIVMQNDSKSSTYIYQFIGIIVTATLHLKFNHYLISIFGGTIIYMFCKFYLMV